MTESMPFEAVKIAMSQTKDGVKLTMVLHPHGDPEAMADLFKEPVGSIYMMALVRVGDDGKPVLKHRTPGENAVRDAAMLCNNPKFQKWLLDNDMVLRMDEDNAASYLRVALGISSRSELATNEKALMIFNELRLRFGKWLSRAGERDERSEGTAAPNPEGEGTV